MKTVQGRWQSVVRVVAVLVLVAAVVPFVVYAVPETAGADESYIVLTASMTPDIAPGDAVLVRAVTAREVRVGDVVTFRSAGSDIPVTHRVVDVVVLSDGTRTFVTKGDANEDRDAGLVTPDALVGKVVLVVPYVGHVVGFVDSPLGFAALVVLPIGLLILGEVVSLARSTRAETTEDDDPGEPAGRRLYGLPDAPLVTAAPDEPEPEAADGIVLSRADLTFTAGALLAFTGYAAWVAWDDRTALAVSVAVAAGATLAMVVALRRSIPPESASDLGDRTALTVDSAADLDAVAATTGSPVVTTADGDRVVVVDDVVYAVGADPDPDPDVTTAGRPAADGEVGA
jgi:signal peptidase